jgi:hypothetical protein
MADHLEKRGDYYYAFLQVPADLRVPYGKAKLRKALGTTDRKVAKLGAMQQVLAWKREFQHLRAVRDGALTPAAIEQDLRDHYSALPDEEPFRLDDGRTVWVTVDREVETKSYAYEQYEPEELDQYAQARLQEAIGVATGKLVRLSDYVDGWLADWDGVTPKTKDMGRSDVLHFVEAFAFAGDVGRVAVKHYLRDLGVSARTQGLLISTET